MGISERDKFLETTFKPVVDPLKEVAQKLGKVSEGDLILPVSKYKVETEGKADVEEEFEEEETEEELEDEPEEIEYGQVKDISEEEEEIQESDPSDISRMGVDIKFKGELGRKYLLKMLQSAQPSRKYHVYGARLEEGGLMIGNSKLDADEQDNIIIDDKKYKGTKGLFELIFKTKPITFTSQDMMLFKEICINTNAHKKGYKPTSPIHRNTSVKYKDIISKLFPTNLEKSKKRFMSTEEVTPFYTERKKRKVVDKSPSGEGLMKNVNSTNIIYYNDVNKLVNRMQLVHEAIEAGNTGLQNEWVALIDELLNRGIVER